MRIWFSKTYIMFINNTNKRIIEEERFLMFDSDTD